MRDVFQYIYTGQARIDEVTLFQTLMVSMALGLEQLSSFCEEYLKLSLSIHTACAYLDATLRQRPYLPEIDGERLLKYLMNFISEHSPECIQTPAFLNLSKEGITYLVSSDYVSASCFPFVSLFTLCLGSVFVGRSRHLSVQPRLGQTPNGRDQADGRLER